LLFVIPFFQDEYKNGFGNEIQNDPNLMEYWIGLEASKKFCQFITCYSVGNRSSAMPLKINGAFSK
jgi:hypothetical protein